ncbi:CinA family protein [Polynucleobacter sp. MWH-P3-07-1]|uniref:CinA family protein n=1 Tax=Polynucleobacter sp. MWH-P3-07-1 TaxID=1743173 RepID=UPI001BFE120A|nr:CinA family protein [Polynucleobacter sp. MWH-P3-07-1]QWD83713.1 CinA family protein [Polynucleobacter sp. MWH-P3-07-1]
MHSSSSLAKALSLVLIQKSWKIALAESCTGGLVCATLTELAGSSDWFERGYITYSNVAKAECLGVPPETIESFGAVSEPVAKAMAEGARRNAAVNVGVAITGIAGPTGGSPQKPVGTVCFAWSVMESTVCKTQLFTGDRQEIREQACAYALTELLTLLK